MQMALIPPFAFFGLGAATPGFHGGALGGFITSRMDRANPPGISDVADLGDLRAVRRMAGGDSKALAEFYDRWSSRVYAAAVSILRSPQDAEEVVEESFWQAWSQASRFDPARGRVGGWLMNIVRSRALDRAKAITRRREDLTDELEPSLLNDASDSHEELVLRERSAAVASALKALPLEQREVVEMAYFGGLSQTEIAEATRQPLGTVKTRIRLAMQKLRERLAPIQGEALA